MVWDKLADAETIKTTIKALNANGISTLVVETGDEARKKVLELIPKGLEVFTVSSTTVESIGLAKEINESGKYTSVRGKLTAMDRNTQKKEMTEIGAAPDWVVGSVHAVTEDGKAMIASGSGSQLPAYVFGASHVVWVVGTHKIVKDMEQGIRRIYERSLPLESERARKAYGVPGSSVNKLLIINKETPGRITLIFVKEVLGF
jgi:L-lactate utilization protein LutC